MSDKKQKEETQSLRTILQRQHTALRSASDIVRSLELNPAMHEMIAAFEKNKALVQFALGPIEDLRRSGIFNINSSLRLELERTREVMSAFEARFRVPEMSEVARLISDLEASSFSHVLKSYAAQTSVLQHAISRMNNPWLDVQEKMHSVASLAKLHGIGHALRQMPTFDEHLTATLRLDLGDWRDSITWPSEVETDWVARSEYYVSLGFNRALTNFPAPAFQESLDIAGLRQEPPRIADLYGDPVAPADREDEESDFERTNIAHDWLLRLETKLRLFIDQEMTRLVGADWPKHRLPNGVYEQWQEKKRKAHQAGGGDRPLIAFADFTDYERIICRNDNWREIFHGFFIRQESVRESFQRLCMVRLDTMHARPISQDDELLLYVEARRLVKAITQES